MRRSLVTLVVLAGVCGTAHAKRLRIMEPSLVRSCRSLKSWSEVTTCFTKHGWGSRVERVAGSSKLFRLDIQSGAKRIDNLLALYIQDAKGIHLGGMYELPGDDASRTVVLGAGELTVKTHTAFKIDLGEERPTSISIDDVTARPGVQLVRHSLYCTGLNWSCADVVTTCDILVDGKTYWMFRGSVTIKDDMLLVDGNRELAGVCAPADRQFFGWP